MRARCCVAAWWCVGTFHVLLLFYDFVFCHVYSLYHLFVVLRRHAPRALRPHSAGIGGSCGVRATVCANICIGESWGEGGGGGEREGEGGGGGCLCMPVVYMSLRSHGWIRTVCSHAPTQWHGVMTKNTRCELSRSKVNSSVSLPHTGGRSRCALDSRRLLEQILYYTILYIYYYC